MWYLNFTKCYHIFQITSYLELILFISELLILVLPLFLDFFQLPIITSLTLEHLKMFLCFLYKYISFSYLDVDLGIEFVATTFSFQSDKISFILCGRKEIWKKKNRHFFPLLVTFVLDSWRYFFLSFVQQSTRICLNMIPLSLNFAWYWWNSFSFKFNFLHLS